MDARSAALFAVLSTGSALGACADEDIARPGPPTAAVESAAPFDSPVPDTFECRVTRPSGDRPPEEPRPSPTQHRADDLYTVLSLDGVIRIRQLDRTSDGAFQPRWLFWRPVAGAPMSVEGHRLDVPAPPLVPHFGPGYERSQLSVGSLTFSTGGCWEVTVRSAGSEMRIVTLIVEGG